VNTNKVHPLTVLATAAPNDKAKWFINITTEQQKFAHYTLLKRTGSPPRRRQSPAAGPWGPCRRRCSRR
jgi:hypothetical protein